MSNECSSVAITYCGYHPFWSNYFLNLWKIFLNDLIMLHWSAFGLSNIEVWLHGLDHKGKTYIFTAYEIKNKRQLEKFGGFHYFCAELHNCPQSCYPVVLSHLSVSKSLFVPDSHCPSWIFQNLFKLMTRNSFTLYQHLYFFVIQV